MATEYGKRLRALRLEAKLTQNELSEITGIPQSTISTAEREGNGSADTPVYAKVFGVNALWLAKCEGDKYSTSQLTTNGIPAKFGTEEVGTTYGAATADNTHNAINFVTNVEPAGLPRNARATPVVGTAKMGDNGYYEALDYPAGQGDGWVDSYSPDPNAYALRVKGDSMHPAIRHGSFVVVEPNGRCMPGEFVAIVLMDGRKMVKELVIEREHEIVIESVNGNHRQTLEKSEIEKIHPIAAVFAASKWRGN